MCFRFRFFGGDWEQPEFFWNFMRFFHGSFFRFFIFVIVGINIICSVTAPIAKNCKISLLQSCHLFTFFFFFFQIESTFPLGFGKWLLWNLDISNWTGQMEKKDSKIFERGFALAPIMTKKIKHKGNSRHLRKCYEIFARFFFFPNVIFQIARVGWEKKKGVLLIQFFHPSENCRPCNLTAQFPQICKCISKPKGASASAILCESREMWYSFF